MIVPIKIASGASGPRVDVLLIRPDTSEGIVGIGETPALGGGQGSSETLGELTQGLDAAVFLRSSWALAVRNHASIMRSARRGDLPQPVRRGADLRRAL